ncbi:hypothetical protein DB31_2527 [Hyalangium minutum]|uniref:Uncharacterized protein n=1 Tax=Hyalangium minutum TaxID=394096 RepID=A0A085W7U6_9BACT|nr:hypothetical protein DB31_2527 [Hyalangium minutum]
MRHSELLAGAQGPQGGRRGHLLRGGLSPRPEDTALESLELPAGVTLEQMMERLERQLIEMSPGEE